MTQIVLWIFVAVLVGTAIYLIVMDKREEQAELMRMQKMRGNVMYTEIALMLRSTHKQRIEEITISEERVKCRYFQPYQREVRYAYEQHGFKRLTDGRMHTLALLLETDYAELKDKTKYRFKRTMIEKENGRITYTYTFLITPQYKDAVNRAYRYANGNKNDNAVQSRYE